MQLNRQIFILIIMMLVPLTGQENKDSLKKIKEKKESPKSSKKKNDIIFSNDQDTRAYIEMLKVALSRVRVSYVDSVNESELIKAGIKGMLKPLDPYTKFLSGSSKKRLDELRTGKYGGVGIQIGLSRDTLTVLTTFEDSPAWSLDIHSGDQILMIDSVQTDKMTLKEASNLIKGELGSVVPLTIFRPSERKKLTFYLTRDNITIKHVPYWGVDEDGIGGGVKDYLRCQGFVNNARPLKNENYQNLKAQVFYKTADLINTVQVGITCPDINVKNYIIEELEQVRTKDADKDNKLQMIAKDTVKAIIGRSPDFSDAMAMRCYYEIDSNFGRYFVQ